MAKKAIIYCRTATVKQDGENNSLKRQSEICRKYANKKGYTVIKEIKECGSGNEINKGLKDAVDIVTSGGADILIATDTDRISRNSWKMMSLVDRLDRKIEFTSFNIFDDSPEADLAFGIMLSLKAFEHRLHKSRCRCGEPIRQKTIRP